MIPEVAEDEVVGSIGEIQRHLGTQPTTFCYPNGDHSPEARALVAQHYACAVTTRRGWNYPRSDRYLLARLGVHDEVSDNATAFLSRLAGVG
jgi:peptidoglycan/xylan/chitin deacetylase (PgdA/CDA1 family)